MPQKRSIFVEISQEAPARTIKAVPHLIDRNDFSTWRKAASLWMVVLAILVVSLIVVGGFTRLTDSGLSITEWQLIRGIVPPLNADAWQLVFQKYQATDEYQLLNIDMTLKEFKIIYWWEWMHRQLGRFIGLVWIVGFVYFILIKTPLRGWMLRMGLLGFLGAAQGIIGWWMVTSGLVPLAVDVASYRLALHLGLAFIILSFLVWYIYLLRCHQVALFQARRWGDKRMSRLGWILFAMLLVQIMLGALVAGIDAGRGYIDWPLMNGVFLPSESFDYTPIWRNFFENSALVHFNHRFWGYLLFIFAMYVCCTGRNCAYPLLKTAYLWVFASLIVQMGLGVTTVIYAVPWHLAIVHQFAAIGVVVLLLRANFIANYPMQNIL